MIKNKLRGWLGIDEFESLTTEVRELKTKVERLQQQRDFDMQKREAQTQEIERLTKENTTLKREKADLRHQNGKLTVQIIEAQANERTLRETLNYERQGLQQRIYHLLLKLSTAEARNQLNEAALRQADTQPIPDENEVKTATAEMQAVAEQLFHEERAKEHRE